MKDLQIEDLVSSKVALLERLIGKKIIRKCYRKTFTMAITHSSFAGENKDYPSNERLEFLGDSVLSLAITHYLIDKYPGLVEGELSKKRAYMVNERALSEKALELELGDIILFGKGEDKNGGKFKRAILADALEAIIAAIFICFGFNEAERFILRVFKHELEKLSEIETTDYKTRLQEIVQKAMHKVPEYRIVGEEGFQSGRIFVAEVRLSGRRLGIGRGKTKKEAEEDAASEALKSEFIEKIDKYHNKEE